MTSLKARPSYLGDPMNFSFPSSEEISSPSPVSVTEFQEFENSLANVSIERAGSVLIKSGFTKVPSFNVAFTPSQPIGNYERPTFQTPSNSSIITDLNYNGQICSVHDVIGVLKAGDLKMKDIFNDDNKEDSLNRNNSIQSSNYALLDQFSSLQKPASRSNTVLFNPYLTPEVVKSQYTESESESESEIESDKVSTPSDFDLDEEKGDDTESMWEDISIPRRSSKRMLIYKDLGVEPNGVTLLNYVNLQKSPISPLPNVMESPTQQETVKSKHESKRSEHFDNLTKMMIELEMIKNDDIQLLEPPIVLNSNSAKSLRKLKSITPSILSIPKDLDSPLRISSKINSIESPMPFTSKLSVRKRSTIKRAKSVHKTLPEIPKVEECELRRTPAIKRKNRFIVGISKFFKGIYINSRMGIRNIKVGGKKLFTFGKSKKRVSKKKVNGPRTISLPTRINIEDSSFAPEILSTFGAYSGNDHAMKNEEENLTRVKTMISHESSDIPLSELKLSIKSVSLSDMTMDSISQLETPLNDFWKLALNEKPMDQETISGGDMLNYDDHAEDLINQFVSSDSGYSTVSTSEFCSSNSSSSIGENSSSGYYDECSSCCDNATSYSESTSGASSYSSSISAMDEPNRTLARGGLRPSMKMTNLQEILKNHNPAANTWRRQLLGPRPMPTIPSEDSL